jgi:hypothetical protein
MFGHGVITVRDALIGGMLLVPLPVFLASMLVHGRNTSWSSRYRGWLERATVLQRAVAWVSLYAILWALLFAFITGLDFLGFHVWLIDHRRPATYRTALLFAFIFSVLYFFAINAYQKPLVTEDWLLWEKGSEETSKR